MSKATLDQWRMLQAVVEHGGFAQASEAIFKSQSTISSSIRLVKQGLGFAWLPTHHIQQELEAGVIKQLDTRLSNNRNVQLYLVFPDPSYIGPAAQKLAAILRECCHGAA